MLSRPSTQSKIRTSEARPRVREERLTVSSVLLQLSFASNQLLNQPSFQASLLCGVFSLQVFEHSGQGTLSEPDSPFICDLGLQIFVSLFGKVPCRSKIGREVRIACSERLNFLPQILGDAG